LAHIPLLPRFDETLLSSITLVPRLAQEPEDVSVEILKCWSVWEEPYCSSIDQTVGCFDVNLNHVT